MQAWVLVRNRYDLLLETRAANVSQALRQLNGPYPQTFNRRHRVGHLLQGRYTALLVDQDALPDGAKLLPASEPRTRG